MKSYNLFSLGLIQTRHAYFLPLKAWGRLWQGFQLCDHTCQHQFIDRHQVNYIKCTLLVVVYITSSVSVNSLSWILNTYSIIEGVVISGDFFSILLSSLVLSVPYLFHIVAVVPRGVKSHWFNHSQNFEGDFDLVLSFWRVISFLSLL